MMAQAVTGTPGHVNTMAAVRGATSSPTSGGTDIMRPGDVYITNDPWKATGHLHDFTATTPVFVERSTGEPGNLIGFFASTAHVVDVGGRGLGPRRPRGVRGGSARPNHEAGPSGAA